MNLAQRLGITTAPAAPWPSEPVWLERLTEDYRIAHPLVPSLAVTVCGTEAGEVTTSLTACPDDTVLCPACTAPTGVRGRPFAVRDGAGTAYTTSRVVTR